MSIEVPGSDERPFAFPVSELREQREGVECILLRAEPENATSTKYVGDVRNVLEAELERLVVEGKVTIHPERMIDIKFVVSELVANAIEHGGELSGLSAMLWEDALCIKVENPHVTAFSTPIAEGQGFRDMEGVGEGERGRGFMISAALSDHFEQISLERDGAAYLVTEAVFLNVSGPSPA